MAMQVVNGAVLTCSFGMAPSTFVVLPVHRVSAEDEPAANIMDHAPMVNIMPFGMCTTPTNPAVASATAAAMGVLTPMPCIPVTPAPWDPGAFRTTINGIPNLIETDTCMCQWGGVISITDAGQVTVDVE